MPEPARGGNLTHSQTVLVIVGMCFVFLLATLAVVGLATVEGGGMSFGIEAGLALRLGAVVFINTLGTLVAVAIKRRRKQSWRDTLPPDTQHPATGNQPSQEQNTLFADVVFALLLNVVILAGLLMLFFFLA